MVHRFILATGLILLAMSGAHAGKIYKIVDENGKVTFSQVPPSTADESAGQVEEVSVQKEAMTAVTEEFGVEFCGDIRLPQKSTNYKSSAKNHAKNVVSSLKRWRAALDNVNDRMAQQSARKVSSNSRYGGRNSSYQIQRDKRYHDQRQSNIERMKDLRCAIDWAEKKEGKIKEFESSDQEERARLVAIFDKLEAELITKCGEEPEFDPSREINKALRKEWYNCSKDLMHDLKKVQNRINRL